ncbi:MAG: FAD-binding protein [Patescibacteria group bacterium]
MTSLPPGQIKEIFAERFGESFSDHQPLSQVLPTGLGGVADYYVVARRPNDIVDAAMLAIEHKIPYRVLGNGTGVLVGESGYPGLIIHNFTSGCIRMGETSRVVVESGTTLRFLVYSLASLGLGGLEFISRIPGTVGGAIASTATFNGQKVSSFVREICLFDPDHRKVATLPYTDAATPERAPLFSDELVFPPIILSATFQLAQLPQDEIIRRLKKLGGKRDWPKAALALPFIDSISQVPMEKIVTKDLGRLGIRYSPVEEMLTFNPTTARPTHLHQAINLLGQQAARFGVETTPRITYLGYYQDKDGET